MWLTARTLQRTAGFGSDFCRPWIKISFGLSICQTHIWYLQRGPRVCQTSTISSWLFGPLMGQTHFFLHNPHWSIVLNWLSFFIFFPPWYLVAFKMCKIWTLKSCVVVFVLNRLTNTCLFFFTLLLIYLHIICHFMCHRCLLGKGPPPPLFEFLPWVYMEWAEPFVWCWFHFFFTCSDCDLVTCKARYSGKQQEHCVSPHCAACAITKMDKIRKEKKKSISVPHSG